MNYEDVKSLLEGTGTTVTQVYGSTGQDPFVMYEQTYVVKTRGFADKDDIKKFFEGKEHVAIKNVPDDPFDGVWRVSFYVHKTKCRVAMAESKA